MMGRARQTGAVFGESVTRWRFVAVALLIGPGLLAPAAPAGARRRALIWAAVASLGALALVSAAPAAAYLRDIPTVARTGYLRDFQTVQAHDSLSSAPLKTVLSGCPAGKIALGTGAFAFPAPLPGLPGTATAGLGLQRMRLSSPPGAGTLVSAVEADPVTPPWLLSVQSQCARVTNVPPGAATGGPYVKDVSVAEKVSAGDSTSPKNVSATCGGGKQSIGGGFASGSGAGFVAVRQAVRVEGGFRVQVQETDPTSLRWQLYVFAICANLTQAGQSYVTDISTRVSVSKTTSQHKVESVDCPSGERAIGGGAELVGSDASSLPPREVTLLSSNPGLAKFGGGTGWIAAAAEEDPTAESWGIRTQVICARVVTPTVSPG